MGGDKHKTELAHFQEQIRKAMAPITRMQKAIAPLFQEINSFISRNREQIVALGARLHKSVNALQPYMADLEAWAKVWEKNKRLREAGFLPHSTTLRFAEDETLDSAVLSDAIEAHYKANWPDIVEQFSAAIETYAVDDEAKATFREALGAHGNGHYRSVCRVLFPEF